MDYSGIDEHIKNRKSKKKKNNSKIYIHVDNIKVW